MFFKNLFYLKIIFVKKIKKKHIILFLVFLVSQNERGQGQNNNDGRSAICFVSKLSIQLMIQWMVLTIYWIMSGC